MSKCLIRNSNKFVVRPLIIGILLSVMLMSTAFAGTSSPVKAVTYGNVTYRTAAVCLDSPQAAITDIVASQTVAVGWMWAQALLYCNGTVVASTSGNYNTTATSFLDAQTSDVNTPGTYYAVGYVKVWDSTSMNYCTPFYTYATPTFTKS